VPVFLVIIHRDGNVTYICDFGWPVVVTDIVTAAFRDTHFSHERSNHAAVEPHIHQVQFIHGVAAHAHELHQDTVVVLQCGEGFQAGVAQLAAAQVVILAAALVRAELAVVPPVADIGSALEAGTCCFFDFIRHTRLVLIGPQRCKAAATFPRERGPSHANIYVF